MGGLHCVELQHKPQCEPVVLAQDGSQEIVLVDERYHYKKDLMGWLLGAKHSYIVTTTASGHTMKWDKVIVGGHHDCQRSMEYDASRDHSSTLHRRSVVKVRHTEDSLSSFIQNQLPTHYDFAEQNCQTHSRDIFNELAQSNESRLPNEAAIGTWKWVVGKFATEGERRKLQKEMAEKYLASTNLRID